MADSPYIYLDYAATCPERVFKDVAEGLPAYANANSLHTPGRNAFKALEDARAKIAEVVCARRAAEVIFTSGATEANNAAIVGIAQAACAARNLKPLAASGGEAGTNDIAGKNYPRRVPHVITSAIEHPSVAEPVRALRRAGFDVTFLPVTRAGFVETDKLRSEIRDTTVLVSIQAANSEIGSIQPIAGLSEIAHEAGAYFHTDATQALGKIPLYTRDVDAMSLSSHKVGGPAGIGLLYLKSKTPFQPQILGGGQESGRRSGTQNVAGAVLFAQAAALAYGNQLSEYVRLRALRDDLLRRLCEFPEIEPVVWPLPQKDASQEGSDKDIRDESATSAYLPNIASVTVRDIESTTLVLRYDALGFAVSGGSACSSNSLDPSHVLTALGIGRDLAQCALRISLGPGTTQAHIDAFIAATPKVLHWGS